jgi:hypothetical protein
MTAYAASAAAASSDAATGYNGRLAFLFKFPRIKQIDKMFFSCLC